MKTYTAGMTKEIHKGFRPRDGKKVTRGEREHKTPEAMANYNDKMSKRKLARILNANFGPEDYHIVFRHPRTPRPTPDAAAAQYAQAKRKVRDRMRAAGTPFKFVSATAIGERGAIHHHMVANVHDLAVLKDIWPHGSVNLTRLYSNGNYAGLAKYFCGQGKGEPGGDILIHGNRWSCSKFLERPEPSTRKITAAFWREPPAAEKGYIIDPLSIDAGVNPYTGAPYLFYRMVRIPPHVARAPKDPALLEMYLQRAQAHCEDIRRRNREEVKAVFAQRFAGQALRIEPTPKGGTPIVPTDGPDRPPAS